MITVDTIGRQTRRDHDERGCDCKGERGCAYRDGELRDDEERCPDCGYVSVDFTHGQVGHDNLCSEPAYDIPEPEPPCVELERLVSAFLDDPMTEATGMGSEMLPLVRRSHFAKHPDCPAKEA